MSSKQGLPGAGRYAPSALVSAIARQQRVVTHGADGREQLPPERTAPIARLVSPTTLANVDPDARSASAVVLATAEELAVVAALGPPWAGLLVMSKDLEVPAEMSGAVVVQVDSSRLALATLSELFTTRSLPTGVHPAAHIDETAELGEGVAVGAGAHIGAGCRIGSGSVIYAGSYVGAGTLLGEGCVLHHNVTVYDGAVLGARVQLHAGAVIGADGFGYAASPRGAAKIHHLGTVHLGDDVEIGANTAIDRATLDATVVGERTKIDNHCQVGHNVRIGSDCLIAGMTGLAGSVTIGDGVIIGGAVGVADHVNIGSGARIAGRSGVTKDVPPGETWAGFPARPYRQYARSLYLAERLESIWEHLKGRLKDRSEDRSENRSEDRGEDGA